MAACVASAGYSQSISRPSESFGVRNYAINGRITDRHKVRERIHTKAPVLHQSHRGRGEERTTLGGAGRRGEVGRVSPASDAEEHFHLSVGFLLDVQLLYATISIVPNVVPCWIVNYQYMVVQVPMMVETYSR